VTMSFNLHRGWPWAMPWMRSMPPPLRSDFRQTIHTGFAGTAQAYQDSLGSEPLLIAAALATVYIVLGVLYES